VERRAGRRAGYARPPACAPLHSQNPAGGLQKKGKARKRSFSFFFLKPPSRDVRAKKKGLKKKGKARKRSFPFFFFEPYFFFSLSLFGCSVPLGRRAGVARFFRLVLVLVLVPLLVLAVAGCRGWWRLGRADVRPLAHH